MQGQGSSAAHRGLTSASGRWDSLGGHRVDDEERASSHTGESIDDIPLVYHGADQIHKTLEFEVTSTAKGDRRAESIEYRDT
jgi:hypothetical protein